MQSWLLLAIMVQSLNLLVLQSFSATIKGHLLWRAPIAIGRRCSMTSLLEQSIGTEFYRFLLKVVKWAEFSEKENWNLFDNCKFYHSRIEVLQSWSGVRQKFEGRREFLFQKIRIVVYHDLFFYSWVRSWTTACSGPWLGSFIIQLKAIESLSNALTFFLIIFWHQLMWAPKVRSC